MINRVVLMGRLVADPELKYTQSGVAVTSFRIAVDRNYVKQGEERKADFFDIVAWRSTAEFICNYFSKGSMIALDGQLQSRNYINREGQNRTAIEVVVDQVSFTGERRDSSPNYGYSPDNTTGYQNQGYKEPQAGYSQGTIDDFAEAPLDDDLPF